IALAIALGVAALRRRGQEDEHAPMLGGGAALPAQLANATGEPTTSAGPDSVESLMSQMRVEPLELELVPDLFDLVDPAPGAILLDRVRSLRRQIALALGIVVPLVRTRDNLLRPPATYVIRVHGVEVGRGEAPPGTVLVLADGDASMLPGRPTTEP